MSDFSMMKGVFNITPTPFHPDDSLDEASLISLTNFTIDQGVDGMTILAVLGETSKVTESERDRIIAIVLEPPMAAYPFVWEPPTVAPTPAWPTAGGPRSWARPPSWWRPPSWPAPATRPCAATTWPWPRRWISRWWCRIIRPARAL